MALSVGGQAVPTLPSLGADPAKTALETFQTLCTAYKIKPAVAQFLVDEGLECLEDSGSFLTEEGQVESTITDKIHDLPQVALKRAAPTGLARGQDHHGGSRGGQA